MSRLLFLTVLLVMLLAAPIQAQDIPWPTDDWPTSSPEAQGIDSGRLADLFAVIEEQDINIHSVLVIRHGVLVVEAYRYPFQPETLHSLQSCTKSVVSTLVGIAIQQGYIAGAGQRVLDLLPDWTFEQVDEAKQAMTIEDLLTMRSGLPYTVSYPQMAANPIQAVLDLPMVDQPGNRFVYSAIQPDLLAAIVGETSGMKTIDFVSQNLFGPLGIQDYYWPALNDRGDVDGNAALWLAPRDMAKIGYLYLRDGQWDGVPILPPGWVVDSTARHVSAPRMEDSQVGDYYGYYWWVDADGYFSALGFGGQAIVVKPDLDLIAVFTSSVKEDTLPPGLFETFILSAVVSPGPLPDDLEKQADLQAQIEAFEQPDPVPVPPLPPIAQEISDRVYSLEQNDLGWTSVALHFDPDQPEAILIRDGYLFPVGLDGVFRLTDSPAFPMVQKGQWIRDNVFQIDQELLGWPYPYRILLTFEGATVRVRVWNEGYDKHSWRFTGTASE